ncbi:Hypothetical protein CINCED_3A016082 [Cinara cedri]|uniref:Uncharacterized protein n=1 Tax=Cinara cedri TaxID=506608 RepID=A0A5E4NM43_9HEMI|nr:Hypothetical protein CINCED_3A016082 [Cinara cedri]
MEGIDDLICDGNIQQNMVPGASNGKRPATDQQVEPSYMNTQLRKKKKGFLDSEAGRLSPWPWTKPIVPVINVTDQKNGNDHMMEIYSSSKDNDGKDIIDNSTILNPHYTNEQMMEGMDNVSGHAASQNNDDINIIDICLSSEGKNDNEKINFICTSSGDNVNDYTVAINSDTEESEADDTIKINKNSNLQDAEVELLKPNLFS